MMHYYDDQFQIEKQDDITTKPGKLKQLLKKGSDHYKKGEIEPIEFIAANNMGFMEGNVIKYITRHSHSDKGLEDVRKAKHYIDMILAKVYGVID